MQNQIQTKQGILEGLDCGSYVVFKGVPYAKPPVGLLRWKAPQELEKWEGVRDAKKFGNICVQDLPDKENPFTGRYAKEFYSNPEFIPEMSEDCLYLNIWMPKQEIVTAENWKKEGLPVAFWIHGGGFSGGYSSELEFDGEEYCKKGVILITVEYRANIFGFLAHPWLDAENELGISGNYGILDQLSALRWVYENIASFGGNPQNITVFGQSAGSMSTQVLVSSSLSEGMIAKAILQSGISCEEDILATPDLKELERYGEMFVAYTGAKNLEELRNISLEQLNFARKKFETKMWETGVGLIMVPNVDGFLLKQTVKEVWKTGEMRKIPYMLGVVTDDLGATPEEVQKKEAGVLLEECRRWSEKCWEIGNKSTYVYHFAHELPGDDWGAFHSSEIWYMFGTYGRCWRPMTGEDQMLSEKMVTYWTNFMKNGTPGIAKGEVWEAYTKGNPYIQKF